MIALAREARVRCWWYAEHRDWLPEPVQVFLSLESAASLIRTYDTQTVPALLQTEAYARAVIAAEHPRLPRAEVERRVRLRTGRGRILTGPNTAKLWAVIDEAALRRPVGDAATMREQLESLRESCKRPNVTIQVLPERDGGNGGSDAPITLLRFPERQFPDVVHLAHVTGGLFLDDPDNVHHYSQLLSRLGIEADWPAQTEAFLDRILDDPQGGMP
ncbi:DUF5753 domain-containing protein [Thermocatellispora tengchongensis]|uniref:DUF5753 domain-containing protein n=1 Tax=Thermocatellispora tengchongensis TaxID=1073253 RepID=UPI0036337530